MAETQAKRLERIEEKIDKITDAVSNLTTTTAVMSTKIEDLELRREESHQRANKFSEKMDHGHECMHDVKARGDIVSRITWGVGAAIGLALINEVVKLI
jgi:predicted  nucleic acid-binding Zn-ribbon protein